MKIPKESILYEDGTVGSQYIKKFRKAAVQLSLESGIFIELEIKKSPDPANKGNFRIDEVLFSAMGHEFGSLDDLKKAIANKSFL